VKLKTYLKIKKYLMYTNEHSCIINNIRHTQWTNVHYYHHFHRFVFAYVVALTHGPIPCLLPLRRSVVQLLALMLDQPITNIYDVNICMYKLGKFHIVFIRLGYRLDIRIHPHFDFKVSRLKSILHNSSVY